VADRFNRKTSWADVLKPHGWRCIDPDGDANGARWVHPGATSTHSATVLHDRLFVYSFNTPFAATTVGCPRGYTKFHAFAVLAYAGDMSTAARQLCRGGM
jgi:hypothetical protein